MVPTGIFKSLLCLISHRVAQSMEALLQLDLDPSTTGRSTAPYGVAHILAAVTVTNNELRAKALAEKDMSVEQYKQLQELQRVKAKDADGNEIEEKKVSITSDFAYKDRRKMILILKQCADNEYLVSVQ